MTAPMAVVGLALITAFPASVSIPVPVLQDVEVKKISSNSFLVLWKKPENVSLETWKNFTYYLRISPKKTTSPVVEYVLDTEGNSTWKEFCQQEADATLQITYCRGRQCENTSVQQKISSFTEASNWFSELKIILSQKQPYVAIGAGITLAISLFVAVIFICCRCKRISGSLNKRDSNFSLDSETNVQAVQFTERGPSVDLAAPSPESISSAAPPAAPDALDESQRGGERAQQPSGPQSLSAHTLRPLPPPPSDVRTSSELTHPSNVTSGATLFDKTPPPLLPAKSHENTFFATLPRVSDSNSTWQTTPTASPATLDRLATRPPADLTRLPSATLPRLAGTKHSQDFFDRLDRRPPAPLPPEAAAPPPLPPWSSGVVVSRLNKGALPPARTPPPATAGARIFFDTARCERDAAPALSPAVMSTATLPRRKDPAMLRQKAPLPPLAGTLPHMNRKMLNRPLPPVPAE